MCHLRGRSGVLIFSINVCLDGWIPEGSLMDPRCIPDGSQMLPRWIPDASQMDPRWIPDGSRMNPGWISDGSPMDPRCITDAIMDPEWSPSMGAPPPPLGTQIEHYVGRFLPCHSPKNEPPTVGGHQKVLSPKVLC